MKNKTTWRLRHPSQAVCGAVFALTAAEQDGSPASLTLRQTSALLTHLRSALGIALAEDGTAPGRRVICSAVQSSDRALLAEAAKALRHVHSCGACGEDSWNACGGGGRHAERTLAAIETALGEPVSVDAVDPHAPDSGNLTPRDKEIFHG